MTERRRRRRRKNDRVAALWVTGIGVLVAATGIGLLLSPLYSQRTSGKFDAPQAYIPPASVRPGPATPLTPQADESKRLFFDTFPPLR